MHNKLGDHVLDFLPFKHPGTVRKSKWGGALWTSENLRVKVALAADTHL